MLNQLVSSKKVCYIYRLSDVAALFNGEGCTFLNFNFSGPLGLEAVYLNLCSGNQLCVVLFRTGYIVNKVSAVLILSIKGSLVVPPGLLCLYIGFDNNCGIQICCHVLIMGHNMLGASTTCKSKGQDEGH